MMLYYPVAPGYKSTSCVPWEKPATRRIPHCRENNTNTLEY